MRSFRADPVTVEEAFRGRTAVVTGAGSGIGRALAHRLARTGARLALSDVDVAGVEDTATACGKLGADVRTYRLDVADRDAMFAHAAAVVADFGEVNTLISNAGVAVSANVTEMRIEDFRWLMDINFWGVVHGTQAFLPHLIASGAGQVVTMSSIFGLIGIPRQSAYNSAKFANRGFTEALREELAIAGSPVTVSCVHPGGIKTNIARNARVAVGDKAQQVAAFDRLARTSPEQAAETILRGVARGKPRILVGPDAWVVGALARGLGIHYQRLITAGARRYEPAP